MPHISEEMWSSLGNQTLCINEIWPLEDVIIKSEIKIAIQINGKTKEIIVSPDQWFGPKGPKDYDDRFSENWIKIQTS